jgi:hypothetical protein
MPRAPVLPFNCADAPLLGSAAPPPTAALDETAFFARKDGSFRVFARALNVVFRATFAGCRKRTIADKKGAGVDVFEAGDLEEFFAECAPMLAANMKVPFHSVDSLDALHVGNSNSALPIARLPEIVAARTGVARESENVVSFIGCAALLTAPLPDLTDEQFDGLVDGITEDAPEVAKKFTTVDFAVSITKALLRPEEVARDVGRLVERLGAFIFSTRTTEHDTFVIRRIEFTVDSSVAAQAEAQLRSIFDGSVFEGQPFDP